jgi:xanthine phosphoribosyltransferase|tara:strand:- start:1240 stop:1677 length:438 start_codon:yes stop_codon:yes gene_type:complete
MEVKEFSFDQVNILARLLATRAKKYNFTHIIGIARGGLVPAAIMSYELDLPLITCSVSSYTENEKGKLKINDDLNLSKFSKDSNLLVVDDICDTGETTDWVTQKLILGGIKHEVACIFTKRRHVNKIKFYGTVVPEDKWIVFPWE